MRIFYYHNVGSSVDHFKSWIDSTLGPSDVLFLQTHPIQIQDLIEFKPDIIIANGTIPLNIEQMFYYKSFFPETKTIILCHVWEDLLNGFQEAAKQADSIILLNCKPDWVKYKEIEEKVLNRYPPVDDGVYKITTTWWDRPNLFGYFGNIHPLKFSHEFIKNNRIVEMDLYGCREFKKQDMSYPVFNRDLNSNKFLIYKGIVDQSKMPDLLNSYKFFILPHSGNEPFNIELLQAIKCGTIPITVRKGTWLHWAKDMHLGLGDENRLLQKMIEIKGGFPDLTPYSETISAMAKEKFGFESLKKEFINIIYETKTFYN